MALLGKLKTGDSLADKGIIATRYALCPFCRLVTKFIPHVLFSCQFSWRVWMHILDWWGIKGVLHEQCENFVLQWNGLMVGRRRGKWRLMILSCVIWSLWFERNKAEFEEYTPNSNLFVN